MLRVLNTAFPAQEDLWTGAVAAIAVASLAIGNLAALVQRNVKRLLAYSSISHAGFLLIPSPPRTSSATRRSSTTSSPTVPRRSVRSPSSRPASASSVGQ